jgi:hypothetical protein
MQGSPRSLSCSRTRRAPSRTGTAQAHTRCSSPATCIGPRHAQALSTKKCPRSPDAVSRRTGSSSTSPHRSRNPATPIPLRRRRRPGHRDRQTAAGFESSSARPTAFAHAVGADEIVPSGPDGTYGGLGLTLDDGHTALLRRARRRPRARRSCRIHNPAAPEGEVHSPRRSASSTALGPRTALASAANCSATAWTATWRSVPCAPLQGMVATRAGRWEGRHPRPSAGLGA